MMKIIVYHFVRNTDLGIHPISLERFESQCKYLKGKDYILTFCDGYKEHADDVLTLLQKYNLKGIFFPCIMPLAEHRVFGFNKNQFLMARLGGEEMANLFENRFGVRLDRETNNYNRFDIPLIGNYKLELHNLNEFDKGEFLNHLFEKHFSNELDFSKKLYMSWKGLKKLVNAGMEIGSHSWNHKMLGILTDKEQEFEIMKSKEILEERLDSKVRWFCYPNNSRNQGTIKFIERAGYDYAVTGEKGLNTKETSRFLLKVTDCTEI